MACPRALASAALLATVNLLFFSLVTSYSPPSTTPTCPKFDACLNLLNLPLLLHGAPPPPTCCSLIEPLAELDAAVCLCAALDVGALGIDLDVTLTLQLLINKCTRNDVPAGFHCTGKPLPPPPKTPSPPPPSAPPTTCSPPPPPPKAPSLAPPSSSPPPPPPYKTPSPPPPPPYKTPSPPPPPPKTYSPPPLPPPSPRLPCPSPPPLAPKAPSSPPKTPPPPPLYPGPACPKLEACLKVDDLLHLFIGGHPPPPCCSLIKGLIKLDAAVCLCAALKVEALGINLDVHVAFDLLINRCTGNDDPFGFIGFKCY